MQTNNTIYEKKHHYMFILKELGVLKNQMEYETLNENLSKTRLQETYDMYNLLIVGLIREGIKFQYIKDSKDSKKDIIRLPIDGVNYDCLNTSIKAILKDEYDDIMGLSYMGPDIDTVIPSVIKKETKKDVKQIESDLPEIPKEEVIKDLKNTIKETIKEEVKKQEVKDVKKQIDPSFYTPSKQYAPSARAKQIRKKNKFYSFLSKGFGLITLIVLVIIMLVLLNNPTIKKSLKNTKETVSTFISEESLDTNDTQIEEDIQIQE